jgi:hypothetical protein
MRLKKPYNSSMGKLDWEKLKARYRENPVSHTKTGVEFKVTRVTEEAVFIGLPSRDEYISRANLEKAVELINEGESIKGPTDYSKKVYDQRKAYAWAILRDMGFIEGE